MSKINFQLLSLMADMFKIGYRIAESKAAKCLRSDKDLGEEGHIHAKALLQEYYKLKVYADAEEFGNEMLALHKEAYGHKPKLEVV